MKKSIIFIAVLCSFSCSAQEEWLTVFIHGAIGFAANISVPTIFQVRKDSIEGTSYEKNVLSVREHPYFFSLQPINRMGFHPVKEDPTCTNAAYAFSVLFDDMLKLNGFDQKNTYYTYGWSGLISQKRRYNASRKLYRCLKAFKDKNKREKKKMKLRLLAYSHGGNVALNLADIWADHGCEPFEIDELILIGLPIQAVTTRQVQSPIFKDVYSIYSRGDKVQRIDATSPSPYNIFSMRTFKAPCLKNSIKQIELRYTAPLRKNPCYCPPAHMRRTHNQSPGHTELWFFGWAESGYRKNLHMYPLPGAVFIPYLMSIAQKEQSCNFQVDLWPEKEEAIIRTGCSTTKVPFLCEHEYTKLIQKAFSFDPSRPEYKETFVKHQLSVDIKAYR